jgi:two-component system, NarL family, response regulator DegU
VATIRVLLADDNTAMLADLQEEFGKEFQIVGTVDHGNDVVGAVVRLDPDVLVLDMTMPGLNGLQVASRIRDLHLRTKILFLTIHEQREYISAAFSVGVNGYVSKRSLARDLAPAIRAVFDGENYLSPSLNK